MFSIRITVLAVATVLAILGCVRCEDSQVAGKCRPICHEPVPIDFERLCRYSNWSVVCATFSDADGERMYPTPIVDGVFRVDHRVALANQSASKMTYTVSYTDNVVIEETVDEKGDRHEYRDFPLALSKEDCLLYYRCSDTGRTNIDTRLIGCPNDVVFSEESLEYLLAVDKKCDFIGELRKLPKRQNK